jgi:hypothetical protein
MRRPATVLAALLPSLLALAGCSGASAPPVAIPPLAAGDTATYELTGYPLGLASPGLRDFLDPADGSPFWGGARELRVAAGAPHPVVQSSGAVGEAAMPLRYETLAGEPPAWTEVATQWLGQDGAVVAMREPVVVHHDNGTRANRWGIALSDGRPDLLNLGFFPGRTVASGRIEQRLVLPAWLEDAQAQELALRPLAWRITSGEVATFRLEEPERLGRGRIDTWEFTFGAGCPFPLALRVAAPDMTVLEMRRTSCRHQEGSGVGNEARERPAWQAPNPHLHRVLPDRLPEGGRSIATADGSRLEEAWSAARASQDYADACPCLLVAVATRIEPGDAGGLPLPGLPVFPPERHWRLGLLDRSGGLLAFDVVGGRAERLQEWPPDEVPVEPRALAGRNLAGLDFRLVQGLAAEVQGAQEAWAWYALPAPGGFGEALEGMPTYAHLRSHTSGYGGASWLATRGGHLADGIRPFDLACPRCLRSG